MQFNWYEEEDDDEDDYDEGGYLVIDDYWTIQYYEDDDGSICAADYSDHSGFSVSFTVEEWQGEVALRPSHVGPSTDYVALREAAKCVHAGL